MALFLSFNVVDALPKVMYTILSTLYKGQFKSGLDFSGKLGSKSINHQICEKMYYSHYRIAASKVYRVLSNYNFGSPIQIKLSSALTLIASLSKTNGMRYRYFSHITCICYIHFKVEIILAVSLKLKSPQWNFVSCSIIELLTKKRNSEFSRIFQPITLFWGKRSIPKKLLLNNSE